jgi:oligoribonuclease (3'-5' exoribonuclease)
MTQYLILDNEMGGTEKEKHSLLTSYFIVTDNKFNIINELSLEMKPNDGNYILTGDSMNVNRIDLKVHDRLAKTYKESGTILYNWLKELTDDGKNKFRAIGLGIHGDIDWITYYLINRNSWEKFVFYQKIEISSITQFLKICGLFPDDVSGSLESLSKYFGIEFNENDAHSAKYDTQKTMEVYKNLVKLGSDLYNNAGVVMG